jgi:hypothetical protein
MDALNSLACVATEVGFERPKRKLKDSDPFASFSEADLRHKDMVLTGTGIAVRRGRCKLVSQRTSRTDLVEDGDVLDMMSPSIVKSSGFVTLTSSRGLDSVALDPAPTVANDGDQSALDALEPESKELDMQVMSVDAAATGADNFVGSNSIDEPAPISGETVLTQQIAESKRMSQFKFDMLHAQIIARPSRHDRQKCVDRYVGTPMCKSCNAPIDICWATSNCAGSGTLLPYCADPYVAMVNPINWYTLQHTLLIDPAISGAFAAATVLCACDPRITPCFMERPVLKQIPDTDYQRQRLEDALCCFQKTALHGKWSRLLYRAIPVWWEYSFKVAPGAKYAKFMSNRAFNLDSVQNYVSTFACPVWMKLWETFNPATFAAQFEAVWQIDNAVEIKVIGSVYQTLSLNASNRPTSARVLPQISLAYAVAISVLHPHSSPDTLYQIIQVIVKLATVGGATECERRLRVMKDPYLTATKHAANDDVVRSRQNRVQWVNYVGHLLHMALLLVALKFRVSHLAELAADTLFVKLSQDFEFVEKVITRFQKYEAAYGSALKDIAPFVASMTGMLPVDVVISTSHRYHNWALSCNSWIRSVIGIVQRLPKLHSQFSSTPRILECLEWNRAFWRYLGWSTLVTTKYKELMHTVPLPLGLHFCVSKTTKNMSLFSVLCDIMPTVCSAKNNVLNQAIVVYQRPKPQEVSADKYLTPIRSEIERWIGVFDANVDAGDHPRTYYAPSDRVSEEAAVPKENQATSINLVDVD